MHDVSPSAAVSTSIILEALQAAQHGIMPSSSFGFGFYLAKSLLGIRQAFEYSMVPEVYAWER